MTFNELKNTAGLDIIIAKIFENQESVPEFAKKYEQYVMDGIEAYTADVAKCTGSERQELVENHAGILISSVQKINSIYFKNGMKTGAFLILQLMGLNCP